MGMKMQEDDTFEKKIRVGRLYDFYGGLLTDKQQKIMEQYFYDDLSLGEIAENFQISRQAVYDLLKRAETTLENYEAKLHMLQKSEDLHFQLRSALNLLDACRREDSPDPRLEKVAVVLKNIMDKM
jgi:predicted DNA-binding protein YlxM (UPF0122 family)